LSREALSREALKRVALNRLVFAMDPMGPSAGGGSLAAN
jgi:hypothetical protein